MADSPEGHATSFGSLVSQFLLLRHSTRPSFARLLALLFVLKRWPQWHAAVRGLGAARGAEAQAQGSNAYCRSRLPLPPGGLSWSGLGVPAGSA